MNSGSSHLSIGTNNQSIKVYFLQNGTRAREHRIAYIYMIPDLTLNL